MLFFTYHRVCRDRCEDDGGFYTVTVEEMERQLAMLTSKGFHAGALPALLAGERDDRAAFITFDDGTRDHVELAAPLLERLGWRGIFFIPTEKIDRPGRVTAAEVRALAAAGHEVGCHSHEHRRLDTLAESEIRAQLAASCARLAELTGQAPRIFAPPGGYSGEAVRRAAAAAGLRALRTMAWGLNRPPRLDALATIPLNRSLSTARLGKILDGRGLAWLRTLYLAKQTCKAFLPVHFYERARRKIFRR